LRQIGTPPTKKNRMPARRLRHSVTIESVLDQVRPPDFARINSFNLCWRNFLHLRARLRVLRLLTNISRKPECAAHACEKAKCTLLYVELLSARHHLSPAPQ